MGQRIVKFCFERCVLDLATRSLEIDRVEIPVQPRVFGLLVALVEGTDEAIPRADLLEAVWEGAKVSPSSLERAISLARIALGPYQERIKTVRGFGYRFEGPVERAVSQSLPAAADDDPERIVGRKAELGSFKRAIQSAQAGQGELRFIFGNPGIGKTRLVEEFRHLATESGFSLLEHGVKRGQHPRAFSVWLQLIAELRTRRSESDWRDATRALPNETNQILQDLAEEDVALSEDSYLAVRRTLMMTALRDLFLRLVGDEPILIVLDDVHWADTASLRMLPELIASLKSTRTVLVLTARREHLLKVKGQFQSPLMGLFENTPSRERLELTPLPFDETSTFLQRLTSNEIPEENLSRLHEQSGGNPLFLRELARLAQANTHSDSKFSFEAMPRSIHDAVLDRIRNLPEETRTILEVASAVGTKFEIALLARLLNYALTEVAAHLAPAEEAEIVRLDSLQDGSFSFTHDLLRESLTFNVPAIVQSQRHAEIAESLENLFRHALESHRERLAEHWDAAALAGHTEEAIRARRNAAIRSRSLWDFERSVEHLDRASELIAIAHGSQDQTWFECRLELGQSMLDAGDLKDGRDLLESLADLASASSHPKIGARAIATLAFRNIDNLGNSTSARIEVARKIKSQLKQGSNEWVALLAGMSFDQSWASFEEADQLSREALNLARQNDSPLALSLSLASRERFVQHPSRETEAVEVARERLDLATIHRDPLEEIRARYCMLTIAVQRASKEDTDLQIGMIQKIEERIKHPEAERFIDSIGFASEYSQAKAEQLDRLFEQVTMMHLRWRRSEDETALYGVVQLALIRATQGRLPELSAALEAGTSQYPEIKAFGAARALTFIQSEQRIEAQKELERILPLDSPEFRRDHVHALTLFVLSWVATSLGDRARCEKLLNWLEPHAGRYLAIEAAALLGSADRMIGRCHEVLGDLDAAIDAYEQAVQIEERIGAAIPLAWVKLDWSRALEKKLLDMGNVDDALHSKAGALKGEAYATIPEACGASLSVTSA